MVAGASAARCAVEPGQVAVRRQFARKAAAAIGVVGASSATNGLAKAGARRGKREGTTLREYEYEAR
jgi:hypothetical protein